MSEQIKFEKPETRLTQAQRKQKYGDYRLMIQSRGGTAIRPEQATLKELTENLRYPVRRVDVERILSLVEDAGDGAHILDLAGGRGFLAKLLADALNEKQEGGEVINFDCDRKALAEGGALYAGTPGLRFVRGDWNKEEKIFQQKFDLVIASWPHPANQATGDFSAAVWRMKPRCILHIGEFLNDFTAPFDPGNDYVRMAEWLGPMSADISGWGLQHDYPADWEAICERYGQNRFSVFVRKDLPLDQVEALKKKLTAVKVEKKYNWEKEMEELYPETGEAQFE